MVAAGNFVSTVLVLQPELEVVSTVDSVECSSGQRVSSVTSSVIPASVVTSTRNSSSSSGGLVTSGSSSGAGVTNSSSSAELITTSGTSTSTAEVSGADEDSGAMVVGLSVLGATVTTVVGLPVVVSV